MSECRKYNLSELSKAVRRKIKDLEKQSEQKFYVAWSFVNPLGEKFLFGRFGKLKDDRHFIGTIAVWNEYVVGKWNTFV